MDINVLRTFVAVCEYAGFSAAGEKLGYSQSTVSSQIKQLETELNTVLIDRIRHKIKVTDDGALVLTYARAILEQYQKMREAVSRSSAIRGELRLAMADSVRSRYFTEDYVAFHRKYPQIRMTVTTCGTEQMFDMLRKNEVDAVITLDSHIYDSEFRILSEAKEQTRFVVSPEHPLAGQKGLTLRYIADQPFILTEKNMSYRKVLDSCLAEQSLEIRPILEISDPNQICRILTETEAVSFLPDFITENYIRAGRLVCLEVSDCDISVWTQVLIHRHKWRSEAINGFVDFFKEIMT